MRIIPTVPKPADEWTEYLDEVLASISGGGFDRHLKQIAEACVARNKDLKAGDAVVQADLDEYPLTWHRLRDLFNALSNNPHTDDPTVVLDEGAAKEDVVAVGPSSNVPAPSPQPKRAKSQVRRRRRPGNASTTFRYRDGSLYEKSDVIGQRIRVRGQLVKISGVGPKAIKVTPIQDDGSPWPDSWASRLPDSMKSSDGGTVKIKDPIFVGLSVIWPIVDKLNPVPEKEEA